jgi:hypothetical protein
MGSRQIDIRPGLLESGLPSLAPQKHVDELLGGDLAQLDGSERQLVLGRATSVLVKSHDPGPWSAKEECGCGRWNLGTVPPEDDDIHGRQFTLAQSFDLGHLTDELERRLLCYDFLDEIPQGRRESRKEDPDHPWPTISGLSR